MITGLERFRDYFQEYTEHYVLIGGVAATQWLNAADLRPRATKDFDIVLLVERLDGQFLEHFWDFVKSGGYENLQKSTGERIYYRFTAPQAGDFPVMLEVFSRAPEGLALWDDQRIIPLQAAEDASSLSAILMDDDYYQTVLDCKQQQFGLSLLSPQGLILLKAKAFIDLSARKESGELIDEKQIRKHRSDVFKLTLLLAESDILRIPASVHADISAFVARFPADSPEWVSIGQASGLGANVMEPKALLAAIEKGFRSL